MSESLGSALGPLFRIFVGEHPRVRVRFWDGSSLGPADDVATITVEDPETLRRIIYRPNDLGFGRAYVTGGLTVEGDLYEAMRSVARAAPPDWKVPPVLLLRSLAAVARQGVLGRPLPPPPEEARLRGRRHSRRRDAAAISHHYDVSNEFYRLILG